jgi:broad specificity phosphatase PhoE
MLSDNNVHFEGNGIGKLNTEPTKYGLNTIGKLADPFLTDVGHQQAEGSANYLLTLMKKENIENVIILSSPLTRVQQTTIPLVRKLKENDIPFSFEFDNLLIEKTFRTKITDDDTLKEVFFDVPILPEFNLSDPIITCRADNDWSDFTKRVQLFAEKLKERVNSLEDKKTLILVDTHSIFMGVSILYMANQCEYMPTKDMGLHTPNGGLSVVHLDKYGWQVRISGYNGYLDTPTGIHTFVGTF